MEFTSYKSVTIILFWLNYCNNCNNLLTVPLFLFLVSTIYYSPKNQNDKKNNIRWFSDYPLFYHSDLEQKTKFLILIHKSLAGLVMLKSDLLISHRPSFPGTSYLLLALLSPHIYFLSGSSLLKLILFRDFSYHWI